MRIIFDWIELQNFMSVGDNPLRIELSTSHTTAIVGKNGSGKSTMTNEGLSYCLFGKSFRGQTLERLVNTINRRGMLARVGFRTVKGDETKNFVVTRGHSPSKFSIVVDGSPIPELLAKNFQAKLDSILGFDHGYFIRSTILGTANYTPFMKMSGPARRDFVETSLSLGVFSDLLKEIKPGLSAANQAAATTLREISVKEAVLEEKKRSNEEQDKNRLEKELQWKKIIEEAGEELDAKKTQLVSAEEFLKKKKEVYSEELAAFKLASDKIYSAKLDARLLESHRCQLEDRITFLLENDNCDKCHQKIDGEFSEAQVSELRTQQKEIVKKLRKIAEDISEWKKVQEPSDEIIRKTEGALATIWSKIQVLNFQISSAKSELEKSVPPKVDIEKYQTEIETLKARCIDEEHLSGCLHTAVELLGDKGVKADIVSTFLPLLNKFINDGLEAAGSHVRIIIDDDFKESFVGRYSDEFTYVSLSEGERTRVDLATMMAWRKVQAMASGVDINLLVLDEIGFNSLDDDGIDALFSILNDMCPDMNIIVISHSSEVQSRCSRRIDLYKKDGFTFIR